MATKITLLIDDKTAAGFNAAAKNAAAFEKSLADIRRESKSVSDGFARMGEQGKRQLDNLQASAKMTSLSYSALGQEIGNAAGGAGNLAGQSNKVSRGLLEASRGVEDFAIQLGPMGLGGAMRAASNNISQMAFVMGGPLAGAVIGVGVALGTIIIPQLFKTKDTTKELNDELDRFHDKLDGISERASNMVRIGDILQAGTTEQATKELENQSRIQKTLVLQQKQLREERERFIKSEGIKTNERGVADREKISKEQLAKLDEIERRQADLEHRRAIVFEQISDLQAAIRTLPSGAAQMAGEKAAAEAAKQVEEMQKSRKAVLEGLAQIEQTNAKQREMMGIQEIDDLGEIEKAISKVINKRSKLSDELKDQAKRRELDTEKAQQGLRKIAGLHETEIGLIRRKKQVEQELDRQREQSAKIREAENRKRLEFEMRFNQQKIQNAAREQELKAQEQMQQLSGSMGFGASQVQGIAGNISQGELLRELAKQRAGDLGGLSRGKQEQAIREQMRDIRKQRAAGTLDVNDLRGAQSSLIDREIAKQQQRGRGGIDRAFRDAQRAETQGVLGGNVTGQQVQQAQGTLIKSSADIAQQQGALSKATVDALKTQANVNAEMLRTLQQQEAEIKSLKSINEATLESQKRTSAQRRGSRG